MMKRTRVDEVQFGTRPGAPVSGGGPGGAAAASGIIPISTSGSASLGVNATSVTIGTVVPSAHNATISGMSSIHHRLLTPQHGGAQTIAYLPSTTPTATNLKTTSSLVDNPTTGVVATQAATIVGGGGAVVVSTGTAGTQTLQFTTTYSVASIQAGGPLKTGTADGNTVQIHVTGGVPSSGPLPANSQSISGNPQTGQPVRQRTISGTQTQSSVAAVVSNLSSTSSQPLQTLSTSQTPPAGQATPPSSANPISIGNITPPQGGQSSGGGSATPRLKVEDALSYLDQVKYQYADQPQIYNNFLDIMKEFKSHCIDTPGVIERVSTLFKGHTELIYGFNMFLPPGYKIEIHSDALGCSVPVVSMPSPPGAPSSTSTVHMITGNNPLSSAGHSLKTPTAATAAPLSQSGSATTSVTVAQIHATGTGAVNLMTHGGASLTQATMQALQHQQSTPTQSQSPGAPHGHVHVSVTSSPTSGQPHTISVSSAGGHNVPQNYSRDRERATITPTAGQVGHGGPPVPVATTTSIVVGGPPTPNSLSELSPHGGGSGTGMGVVAAAGNQHNLHHIQQAHQSILLGETTGQQNQPVEFNHAITYVNKIKNRFQNQPAKYKKFLEILHAYQKEQKVIKEGTLNQGKMLTEQEVYTQVAKLFGQDEDLLREFGQFLPDATNHQSSAAAPTGSGGGQYLSKSSAAAIHNHHHDQQQNKQRPPTATLSGGAHISMSSTTSLPTPHSGGSPLHLSSGATLSSVENSANAHAAAIGNLSAVNTSVSIKTYNNNNSQQQNHAMGSGLSNRNDVIFDKDYNAGLPSGLQPNQRAPGIGHHTVSGHPVGNLRAGGLLSYDKEHRNNHHVQKYVGSHHHHAQNQSIGQHMKKSPIYGGSGLSSITNLGDHSLDRSSPGVGYATTPLPTGTNSFHSHHNQLGSGPLSISRRPLEEHPGSSGGPPPAKRPKPYCRDVSFSEASSKCTISDAAFFDKVRKALRSPDVYDNFLRCLTLFNQEIVSKTELLGLVSPFLTKFPDLLRWFTDFLGPTVGGPVSGLIDGLPLAATQQRQGGSNSSNDRAGIHQSSADYVQDVDLSLCKRLGASYCALPPSTVPKKCSGRTALCKEVLNDKWVSFPTWASEDSTFVTSRKTQFEETIYRNIHRTEDERFELDLVIEVNSATIRVLENVQKKMSRMSSEELAKFHLDDHLGGTSQTIHQRAIHRIYGDKSGEIIQGMKKSPSVAVPIVLKRLKVKEEEWRDAQKNFNKQWREQNEKYYLKSLDHQAINFKPNDMKALRSKSLFNEIETLYDERHDQEDDMMDSTGPHLILPYKDKTILDDAANLLIHHVKRQTGIQKQEKQKIKQIIRQFVPDLFYAPRQPLSDDERDDAFQFLVDDNTKVDVDLVPLHRTSEMLSSTDITCNKDSENISSATSSPVRSLSGPSVAVKKEVGAAITGKPINATNNTATGTSSTTDDIGPSTSTVAVVDDLGCSATTLNAKRDFLSQSSRGDEQTNTNINSTYSIVSSSSNSSREGEVSLPDVEVKQEKHSVELTHTHPSLLPLHAQSQHQDESYSLFFANNNWYLFLRLHAILCDRLHAMYERARLLAIEEERSRANRRESTATALRLKPKPDIQMEDYYPTFLDMLKNVLDGNMDSNTFEDTMREMFGIYAYISFTLDKVVSNAVRQLQYCVTERAALDCVELYATEQRRGSTGGFCRDANKYNEKEMVYQRKAENILNEENCFKVYIYKIDCRVTIELLDSEPEELEKSVIKEQKFSKYVEHLANPAIEVGGADGRGSSANIISNAVLNLEMPETSEIKKEEEEENAEHQNSGGKRKPRFLLRNKRRSKLHEEQVRQLFEQKKAEEQQKPATTIAAGVLSTGSECCDSPISNNNNSWSKRLPERLGTPQVGLAEQYAFNDRDEINAIVSNGRCFVTSKNLKLLKYDAVRRAKKSHCRVTQAKHAQFQIFVNKWLQKYVSDQQHKHCTDWLLGRTSEQVCSSGWGITSKTKCLQNKDTTRTPYRVYSKYKVIQVAPTLTTSSVTTSAVAAQETTSIVPSSTATAFASSSSFNNTSNNNTITNITTILPSTETTSTPSISGSSSNRTPQQQLCNSAAAAANISSNSEAALQQVRPMES
ncbi:paired amphipathic helix protein Sin3a isoform X1 [Drosophila willistoni]|uniref:paired amphipathic helix protein Sin3a isoform X1 n=1 Tax=Drosophila willistoni TaxID=7260 RepID=UPI000C26D2D1|nr:paired amphipathic helix protein Sin3a isoform X1 [Drosophila willistoni]